jgi:hypothetical protein
MKMLLILSSEHFSKQLLYPYYIKNTKFSLTHFKIYLIYLVSYNSYFTVTINLNIAIKCIESSFFYF